MIKKKLQIILFTILCGIFSINTKLYSQNYIEINGKIVDEETNAPLVFANIGVAGNKFGTITNENGEFRFKLPDECISEKLQVSFLGYKSKDFFIKNLLLDFNIIKLKVLPISLSSVDIIYKSPEDIILEVLNKVPDNFLNKPAKLKAFYRESIYEGNDKIQFIEAVLEIYKGAYANKKDKDRIRILKGRQFEGLKKSIFFEYLYFVNGPYEVLQLDVAKYPNDFINVAQSNISFLKRKHFKHYTYSISETTSQDEGHASYIIQFKPIKKRALFEGKLIVDKESKAILAMEYRISDAKLMRTSLIRPENESYLNEFGMYTKAVDFRCIVIFKKYKGKYIISNSKLVYSFLFANRNNEQKVTISNSIDFVVTSIETENVKPFKFKHRVWKETPLTRQLGDYDPDFWGNFTTIKNIDFKFKKNRK